MKLTTKGRYAVTAMLDLAVHQQETTVALGDIAARQGISLSYLEQLFAKLRRKGLVSSVRGPGGGYSLGLPASGISVAQIIMAINEDIDATRCRGEENCHGEERCLTHQLWTELSRRIYEFLDGITLADLVTEPGVQEVVLRQAQRGAVAVEVQNGWV
ncbi:MAG: Rrf2 family transcriptional regulator [Gammaproteobacteria bacterium]|nr:Rrf2 family transcriptional regulator [Gammaproteobacteria bacterium]